MRAQRSTRARGVTIPAVRHIVLALGCAVIVSASLAPSCTPKEPVEIGSACSSSEKTEACAVGQAAVCRGGTWQAWATCTGPKGCSRYNVGHGSTAVLCDGARGRAGGPCPAYEGMTRCSTDGLSRLVCHAGLWSVAAPCPGGCSEKGRGKEVYLSCMTSAGPDAQEIKIQ